MRHSLSALCRNFWPKPITLPNCMRSVLSAVPLRSIHTEKFHQTIRLCWVPKKCTSRAAAGATISMERLINFFKTSYCFLNSSSPIWTLFKKDVLLEIRQQYAFYGVVLYVGATIFVLYMAIEEPESRV